MTVLYRLRGFCSVILKHPALSSGLVAAMVWAGCGRSNQPNQVEQPAPNRPGRPAAPASAETTAPSASDSADLVPADNVTRSPDLERGLSFKNERVLRVPWSINVLRIDRSRKDLVLTTTSGRGRMIGLGPLSEQLEAVPPDLGQAIAAINGDFYRTEQEPYPGDPRGVQISRSELISAPTGKTAFWVDSQGKPVIANVSPKFRITWPGGESTSFGLNEERHANDAVLYTSRMGPSTRTSGGREFILGVNGPGDWLPLQIGRTYSAAIREIRDGGNSGLRGEFLVLSVGPVLLHSLPQVAVGATIQLSTETTPDLAGVAVAIGGGPILVHEGKAQPAIANKSRERHPRSAFGWNDTSFFFVEVDGRQHGFSVGMTLPELATYLVQQGCQEAMNLDGGGSAEMWVEGKVVNRPCFGYERNTGNALVLVRQPNPGAGVP